MHDSPGVLNIRSLHYRKNILALKEWYSEQHDNYRVVDGCQSVWQVWKTVNNHALHSAVQIKHYLHRIKNGTALYKLQCIACTQFL